MLHAVILHKAAVFINPTVVFPDVEFFPMQAGIKN